MKGGKHLLLLAAFVVLARCQQKLKVLMSPNISQIYSGDLIYLKCDTSGGNVKWYLDGTEQSLTDKTWKIPAAGPKNTGSYQCESNGQKSDPFSINVLDYLPRASLRIHTGQPVMRLGSSVILKLDNEDGLQGWRCWVYRGDKRKKIMLKLEKDSESHIFSSGSLNVNETIFWCTDKAEAQRSNQITVRTSENPTGSHISLEMYPLPAVEGESLTLRCLTWGTNRNIHTIFYKGNTVILDGPGSTYQISHLAESDTGKYKCDATFYQHERTSGPAYHLVSDSQDVFVQVATMRAFLSGNVRLSCSCPEYKGEVSYRWYLMSDGQLSALKNHHKQSMTPEDSGTYACRAVWSNGMSFLSNSHYYESPVKTIIVIVVIALVILGFLIAAIAFYCRYKKRNVTGPIYEDVALTSRNKGDGGYEELQNSHGPQVEGEYHTLQPEGQGREKAEGQYEPLKAEGMKPEVYHTLGAEGAAGGAGGVGGAGGYEALRKEGVKEGVYHTLGMEGEAGGAGGVGGYEALRKGGMKPEVYHTLGTEGAAGRVGGAGGAGGYEALRKEEMKPEVYHTLGTEGAAGGAGGAGGYEALRKEGMKPEVYHTLGTEGAAGGD